MDLNQKQFLAKLIARAYQLKRKTLELADCKSIYYEHFSFLSESNRWEIMANWLHDLKNQNLIDYSKNNASTDFSSCIPLPNRIKITIPDERSPKLITAKDYQWLPELIFLASVKNINKSTEAKFRQINEFLRKKDSTLIALSIKERSLQVLGDEKALEPLAKRYENQIDLQKKLNYYFTYEPIHGQIFSHATSHKIIILENRDTYNSFLRINHELNPPPYHGVFYGQGKTISNSFPNIISRIAPEDEIHYFGDIDYGGVEIAQNLIEDWNIQEPKRKIIIAERFYFKIIEMYQSSGFIIKNDAKIKSPLKEKYYSPELLAAIKKIFDRNERIPQEFLNFEILKSNHNLL